MEVRERPPLADVEMYSGPQEVKVVRVPEES